MKVDDFLNNITQFHKLDMPRIDAGPRIQAGGLTHLYWQKPVASIRGFTVITLLSYNF